MAKIKRPEKSTYEIARAVGVSHQAVSKWYTGKSMPTLRNLLFLARYLDEDPKKLASMFLHAQSTAKN